MGVACTCIQLTNRLFLLLTHDLYLPESSSTNPDSKAIYMYMCVHVQTYIQIVPVLVTCSLVVKESFSLLPMFGLAVRTSQIYLGLTGSCASVVLLCEFDRLLEQIAKRSTNVQDKGVWLRGVASTFSLYLDSIFDCKVDIPLNYNHWILPVLALFSFPYCSFFLIVSFSELFSFRTSSNLFSNWLILSSLIARLCEWASSILVPSSWIFLWSLAILSDPSLLLTPESPSVTLPLLARRAALWSWLTCSFSFSLSCFSCLRVWEWNAAKIINHMFVHVTVC